MKKPKSLFLLNDIRKSYYLINYYFFHKFECEIYFSKNNIEFEDYLKSLLDAFPNLNFSSYASVETNILYDKVVIDFSSLYNDTLNILEKIKFNNLIVLLNPNIGLYEKLFSKY